jgi:hypothetical protein
MDTSDTANWDSWPVEVVFPEVESFQVRAQTLLGLFEEQLRLQLGQPGEVSAGTRWETANRELILQADRDLRYFDVLPHVVVSFAIADAIVKRVTYWPKWRRCPPECESQLGGGYVAS